MVWNWSTAAVLDAEQYPTPSLKFVCWERNWYTITDHEFMIGKEVNTVRNNSACDVSVHIAA